MRTRVFSPTYPTWALVGGTSRPAGETVSIRLSPRSEQSWSAEVREPLLLLQLARLRLPAVAGELELVQREELLQEALHGPRQLRDPAGVGLGQGLHGR